MSVPSPSGAAATGMPLLTVGIDVGGTKTSCVVTDADDRLLLHEVEPTQADQLTQQLSGLIGRAVERIAADAQGAIAAVGVAVPGRVEPTSGTIALAVNLGGRDLALGPLLEQSVGLPCFIEHDARAAAAWLTSRIEDTAREATGDTAAGDLAYLSLGTGISAGIVLNGRVLRGDTGLAGEVGHVAATVDGEACACGLRGCLEVVAAGPAIARMARAAMAAGRPTSLRPDAGAADVFAAAAADDQLAVEVVSAVAEHLARAIRGLVLTLGVSHIVIGGGVAAAGDALLGPLMAVIGRERAASPLVDAAFKEAQVELLPAGAEAGARGAAAIARQRVNANEREGVGSQ